MREAERWPVADIVLPPAANASSLLVELDCLSWGIDTQAVSSQCADLVERLNPLWLRVANWAQPTVDFLKRLPGRRVVWKIEYTGHGVFDPLPGGTCWAAMIAEQMVALELELVVYTFNQWNVDQIRDRVPVLRDVPIHAVPVAQKPGLASPGRAEARARLRYSPADTVLGIGGVLGVPHKGIEETVDGFLRTCAEPGYRLLAQVIPNPLDPGRHANWRSRDAAVDNRLTVQYGRHNNWAQVTAFYRALDCFLVPSTGESWCRMLAEAVAYGIPALAVRANSATNVIIPGLTLVDQLTDFRDPALREAMAQAAVVAPQLRRYVLDRYNLLKVRAIFAELLRRHTDPRDRPRLERLLTDENALRGLDAALVH